MRASQYIWNCIYGLYAVYMLHGIYGLNGTVEVVPTSELITETVETMIPQSVLQELEKQKATLTIQEKEKTDSGKVNSPVNRKSTFRNRISKGSDKKGKKLMCDNISDEKKEHSKKDENQRL